MNGRWPGILLKVKIILKLLLGAELLHEEPDGKHLPGDAVEQTLRVSDGVPELRYIIVGLLVLYLLGLYCIARLSTNAPTLEM